VKTINFLYKFRGSEIAFARKQQGMKERLFQRVKERLLIDTIAKEPFEEKPMWFRITHKVRYHDVHNYEMSKEAFYHFIDELGDGKRPDIYFEEHLFIVEVE